MRLSLFHRILIWFILNLMILLLIFFGYVNIRVHVPPDSFLASALEKRLQLLPFIIGRQLSTHSAAQWDDLLEQQAKELHVDIFLLSGQGLLLAGSQSALPAQVQARAKDYFAAHIAMLTKKFEERSPGSSTAKRPAQPHNISLPPPLPLDTPLEGPIPFFMKTDNPARHWAGLPILVMADGGSQPVEGVLLVSSDSITGHGLFFNPTPWLLSIAMILIFSMLWWWPLIRSITSPLARVSLATEKIANGQFEVKLPEKRGDEIGRLSRSINRMALRLKELIWGHKQFLGNVAHELASPVARIKLGLGILEQEIPAQHRPRLQGVMEDAEHMSSLLDELLSFSRAELNPAKTNLQDVALLPLVQKSLERENQLGAVILPQIAEDITVHADPDLLIRALCNLIRNAIRYAGMAGPIRIKAARENGLVRIVVQDNGPGVPEQDITRIFETFYQTESSRKGIGGVGLGLSIVKTCVEACGGTVSCRNRRQGGLEVVILLKPGTNQPGGGKT